MAWFNLNENASYPRPAHWVLVLAEVFLCHSIYLFLCPFECHFPDASADYGRIVGSGRVADIERDFRIPDGVSVLLAPLVGVDNDDVSLMVNPCLSDVRGSIRHQGGKVRINPSLDKFLDGLRKRSQFTSRNRLRFCKHIGAGWS